MNNPNKANNDFNPILHTKGQQKQAGVYDTTSKSYGSVPPRPPKHQAPINLIPQNTNQKSNNIFG